MRSIIFVNGDLHHHDLIKKFIRSDDFLIAADGGLTHIQKIDLQPHLVIGDLDSINLEDQQWLKSAGIEIAQFPAEKDQTDLELAIAESIKRESRVIVIIAATGGRLDQTLANLMLMLDARLENVDVRLEDGKEEIFFIDRCAEVVGNIGDRVSLLAINGTVKGIETKNLKYPLAKETLVPGQTRGISNIMLEKRARIDVKSGRLLCIHTRMN